MDVAIRLISALTMVALPLIVGILVARKTRASWRLFGIGALTFVASQVLHLPFNAWVLQPLAAQLGLSGDSRGLAFATLTFLFGLSAGLFEELARFLTLKFWLRDIRSAKPVLMYGAGHGGVEAMLLGGVAFLTLFQSLALRNSDLTATFGPDQALVVQAQLEAYWSAPWHLVILGPIERALAIGLHLTLAYLVLQTFTRRSLLWLGVAVLWHTIVNTVAVYSAHEWGPYAAEALIAALVFVGLGIITSQSAKETEPLAQVGSTPRPPLEPHLELPSDISQEKLNNSRFTD